MSPLTVTALIPAHNEETNLRAALATLHAQTIMPDRILVVSDRSTDDTARVARELGADVLETQGNTDRKAGALNQALTHVTTDVVLVLDADTTLVPTFLEDGLRELDERPGVAAAGGVFRADQPTSLLRRFQSNEYERYAVKLAVTGRLEVLTGTAACIRASALRQVAAARGGQLPGTVGDFYDRQALTEDSELTLALRTLGHELVSPTSMVCTTETMPTWGDLHRQRVRWYLGMLDNLRAYGLTRVTARYAGQQFMIGTGLIMIWLLFALTAITVVTGTFAVIPFWLGVMAVFVAERVLGVWDLGWRSRLLSLLVLPDLTYDLALQVAYVRAACLFLARREVPWNHVSGSATRQPG